MVVTDVVATVDGDVVRLTGNGGTLSGSAWWHVAQPMGDEDRARYYASCLGGVHSDQVPLRASLQEAIAVAEQPKT